MAKKSSDYWKKRFEALENTNYKESMKYYEDLQKQFRMASNEIQAQISSWYARIASNNDISYSAAKKFLNKKEIKEFKWSVEEYIKYGEENAINQKWMKELENASARVHISKLEAMQLQMQQTVEKLFVEYEGGVSDFLGKTFSSGYYNTAYEIAKGTGIGVNLHALDSDAISDFISKPWALDGKNFSDRIWTNKEKLVQNLHTELTQQVVRGSSPKQAIDAIARKMDVSKSQAGNLVMTESAAIASAAKKQCLKDLDVEEFEVVVTLDSHTSQICRDMDGKHFPMSEYEIGKTAPPFHCRCRSCTCPFFDDEFTEGEERVARDADGNNYTVPADMTYNEWEKKYVINSNELSSGSDKIVVNKITNQNVDKVPLVKAGNMTDEEALELQQMHRNLLNIAMKNDSVEVGKLIKSDMSEIDTIVGTATSIDLNVPGRVSAVFVMHNHPNNSSFSNKDLLWLIKNDNVKYFSIVKNNGSVELIHVPDTFDRIKFETEYGRLCKKFQKDIANNEQKGYDKVIQSLLTKTKSGIEYVR